MLVVLLLAEMTHDQEALGSSPANSKLFCSTVLKFATCQRSQNKNGAKITA